MLPLFISLEGTEGCGKTTVLTALKTRLEKAGILHIVTREPGGSTLGKSLRPLLLNKNADPLDTQAELFLFMADRVQHIQEIIKPALAQGKYVLCDRYADSTIAYQGFGRGLDVEWLLEMHNKATQSFWPHITLWLDLPVEKALARARLRHAGGKTAQQAAEGRFEEEDLAFHTRIYQGFAELSARFPQRILRVNAQGNKEQVFHNVLNCLHNMPKSPAGEQLFFP